MPPITDSEPTGQTADIDVDKLLADIEGTGEAPASTPAPTEGQTMTPAAPAATAEEFTFNASGKQIKAPKDKVIAWAQRGYDYDRIIREHNEKVAAWEADKKKHEEKFATYIAVDEYAQQNRPWWDHVSQAWQARNSAAAAATPAGQGQTNTSIQIPKELTSQIDELKAFKQKYEAEQAEKQREKDDQILTQDVQSIRKEYPNLDWTSADETGLTLEQRVLKHGIENGLPSFKVAFRDYKHDQLLKLAEERGKEALKGEMQKNTKAGLIGKTQSPTKGITPAQNVKNKSYSDLLKEGAAEFGVAL